jgi:hypothetical protein
METDILQNAELVESYRDSHLEQVLMGSIFIRSKTVVSRSVAGETLIVPIRGKVGDLASIYGFNGTGSLIWQSLESPKTVAELTAAVVQEYAVEPEQAERDVKQFVSDMLAMDLVDPQPVAEIGRA